MEALRLQGAVGQRRNGEVGSGWRSVFLGLGWNQGSLNGSHFGVLSKFDAKCMVIFKDFHLYLGVSKNHGIPKSSTLIGFPIILTIHFGFFPPIFGSTPTYRLIMCMKFGSRCHFHDPCGNRYHFKGVVVLS